MSHRPAPDRVADLLDEIRIAGDAGRHRDAVRLAREALRQLDARPGDTELRATVLVNLGSNLADVGRMPEAMQVFDDAARTDPGQLSEVESARGLVLYLARRHAEALDALDRALAAWSSGNERAHCAAFVRRGSIRLALGEVRGAAADYEEAARRAHLLGRPVLEFMSRHNLGYVRFVQGDLPGALREMDAARTAAGPDIPEGVPHLDRARVLLDAGLLQEARVVIGRAVDELEPLGAGAELADAHLTFATVDMLDGNAVAAGEHAEQARGIAQRAGLTYVALLAELQSVAAASTADPAADRIRDRAVDLAATLGAAGLREEAATAQLLAAEAALHQGDPELARAGLLDYPELPHPPVTLRLHRRTVNARIAKATGAVDLALTELAIGLDDLSEFSSALGSPDMQAAAAVHGLVPAQLGVGLAVDSGDPALVLQWLERSRAVSSRLPPVTPPDDPELADLLSQVRLLTDRRRELRAGGRTDPALTDRIAELHGRIRGRTWTVSGHGSPDRPIGLAEVQALLGADRRRPSVLAYLTGRDAIWVVAVTADRATFRRLGPWSDDPARHRRRHADLDLLAAARIPLPLRKVARTSVDRELTELDSLLLGSVADLLDPGPLVIAAVGDVATVPWLLLPGLGGRPVTVHSSVTAALRPRRWSGPDHLRGVVAVAGPEVATAESEVASVVATHPGAIPLGGAGATGRALLDAVPQGGLLHIAAHGHHDAESPLFSHVLLADGPLYGYDIAPNRTLPAQVVLSSCDVGRSSLQPGNEPLGLAAALLRSGVGTVVAGVTRVNDDLAALTMVVYHRELAAGSSPAAALAVAVTQIRLAEGELAAFTCFGSADLANGT